MTQCTLNSHLQQTLALAGVFQAAALTKQIAWRGLAEEQALTTSLQSIFKIDANDVIDVYGQLSNLEIGLKEMIHLFDNQGKAKDPEVVRYALSLLHLERKLIKQPKLMQVIQQGIERARHQTNHFPLLHDNVIANLANIYTDSLSTFSFRIHVVGEESLLRSPNMTNRVRACLLAGIRSAVLWRQLGGSRLQLIFGRKKLVRSAQTLLKLSSTQHSSPLHSKGSSDGHL